MGSSAVAPEARRDPAGFVRRDGTASRAVQRTTAGAAGVSVGTKRLELVNCRLPEDIEWLQKLVLNEFNDYLGHFEIVLLRQKYFSEFCISYLDFLVSCV